MVESPSSYTPLPLSPPDAKPFSVDALFHRAWERFTSRFVKAFLTQLLSFGLIMLATLGAFLIIGLLVLIAILIHNPVLYLILAPAGIVVFLFYIYMASWVSLSYIRILIRDDPQVGIWQNMTDIRPRVMAYFILTLLMVLFVLGFSYLLFIPAIVWSIWGVFTLFIFLEDGGRGLLPLWKSRQLVKGYFWAVVGRLLLFGIASWALVVIFSLNRYTSVISFVLSLVVIQPLQIAFNYQIYLVLKKINPIKDKPTGGMWPYLSILGWILSIILIIVTSSLLVNAIINLSKNLKQTPSLVKPNSVAPTSSLIPTIGQKKVASQIDTMEQAMVAATTTSGMEHADTARVRGIKLLYTPTYKNWTFDFTTRFNKHQSSTTFANVYSEDWVTVKVNSSGEVSVDTGLSLKDQPEEGVWLYQPTPQEAANSSYLDMAKQKMIGAGLTPGTIIDAEFSSLGVPNDTSGFNSQWKVAIVVAGNETSTNKKSKTFSFMGGNYTEMYDSTVTIY